MEVVHYQMWVIDEYSGDKKHLNPFKTACGKIVRNSLTEDFNLVTCSDCISHWDLSERVVRILDRNHVAISQLSDFTSQQLLNLKGFGKTALNEINDYFGVRGISIKRW
jgi:DNA-directed RNA polymerase alpha subunit